jgi:hypothetical protein
MADWVTISSLATAGGTLVLAAATFASVRSANRAAVEVTPSPPVPLPGPRPVRRPGVELLYGDHEGGQRMVSRFALNSPRDGGTWLSSVGRHWNLDRPDPR